VKRQRGGEAFAFLNLNPVDGPDEPADDDADSVTRGITIVTLRRNIFRLQRRSNLDRRKVR
jgi:hypothetical protein